jgi:hypothetical protein
MNAVLAQFRIERAAYQWWNTHLSTPCDPNRPPELVVPSIARSVWSNICPIFLLFVVNENDVQKYWESIHAIVTMFDPQKNIPNPILCFPQFIARVHSLLDVLTPRTVIQSVNLINRFGFHDSAHCFLYQCPVFLLDPSMYLETILSLRQTHHHLWSSFSTNPRLIDAFFRLYANFITPLRPQTSPDAWRHRCLMTEVLSAIVHDVAPFHSGIDGLVFQFLDMTIPLLSHAGIESAIQLLRPILSALRFFSRQLSKEMIQSRVILVLDMLDRSHSVHFGAAVRFLLPNKPMILTHGHVCQIVTSRAIRGLADFDLYQLCCDSLTVSSVIQFLARNAVMSKLWNRACMASLFSIVQRFSNRPDIHDWFCTFIRRLFVFICVATTRGKYRERVLRICEAIAGLRSAPLWMQQAVTAVASSAATKTVPMYFRIMFPYSPTTIDEIFLKEVDIYSGIGRFLKTFPFDPIKRTFLQPAREDKLAVTAPVNPRSSCRKVKVMSPPPAAKKKNADKKKKAHKVTVRKAPKNTLPAHRVSSPPRPSIKSPRVRRGTL